MAPIRGHSDGGGVAGKSQGLALGQTGGEAGAEGGHKGVAGGRGVGHMLHLHAVGVMDAVFPAAMEPFSPW